MEQLISFAVNLVIMVKLQFSPFIVIPIAWVACVDTLIYMLFLYFYMFIRFPAG